MKTVKTTIGYILLVLLSLLLSMIVATVTDSLFLEDDVHNKYIELFEAGKIPMPSKDKEETYVNINVEWPVKALIFYYGILSIYWFFFGFVLGRRGKSVGIVLIFLTIPIVISALNIDVIYIFSILTSIIGVLFSKKYTSRKYS